MSPPFALYYASKTIMRITQVTMLSEEDARAWFGKCQQWQDVVRIRMTNLDTGEVVQDMVMEHRIAIPDNPDREEKIRELVARMDRVFVADRQLQRKPRDEAPPAKLTQPTVDAQSTCWCGHLKIEHSGADSSGRCHSPDCVYKCQRFRRRL